MELRKENEISPDFYVSDAYAGYLTTFSLIEQVRWVHSQSVKEVLYVGVGNGFVPAVLKAKGISVTTVDINPDLKPDVVSKIQDLEESFANRKFEAVMACEVLEHIPLEEFDDCIEQLAGVCQVKALITIPVYCRFLFRFASVLKVGSCEYPIGLWMALKKSKLPKEHQWEIGSSRESSLGAIHQRISRSFNVVSSSRMRMNPYHHAFSLVANGVDVSRPVG